MKTNTTVMTVVNTTSENRSISIAAVFYLVHTFSLKIGPCHQTLESQAFLLQQLLKTYEKEAEK